MRITKFFAASALTVLLAACGAGSSTAPQFSSLVSFGDSLSDVGSYRVGTIAALSGGKFTINGPDGKIWIDQLAARLNLPAPCAAMTGLDGDPAQGLSVPVATHPGCTAYGQGGARVTNAVGPYNRLTGSPLGQLTVPVLKQINNHLAAVGGAFKGDEIVVVQAGGNDVFMNLAAIAGGATPTQVVTEMGKAGAELAGYIKAFLIGKGAQYVAVVNLPDVSKTPYAYGLKNADGTPNTALQGLINTMSSTFNTQLKKGLDGTNVIYVDAYTIGRDQAANPGNYGIGNGTIPACNLDPAVNPFRSLACNAANVIPGDISKYQFADDVHPTPFGYSLISNAAISEMAKKGWIN
jgi:phospholipase/lecithinase/hemolysin